MDAGTIVVEILGAVAKVAPGFLALFSGKANDAEALDHAREAAARFRPVTPGMRARSARARAAAAAVTVDDVRRAETIATSPSTGVAHSASIRKLADLARHEIAERAVEEAESGRGDEPTVKGPTAKGDER